MKLSTLFVQVFLVALLPALGMSAYNQTISLEMCYMSDISYETIRTIDAWSCSNCSMYTIKNQVAFENTATASQGFAGYLPNLKAIVLAFRGT